MHPVQLTKDFSYFDSAMNLQKTTAYEKIAQSLKSEAVRFGIPCLHHNHRYCYVDLFLKNNPWTHYKSFAWFGCVSNRAEFYFRDCIVCGTNRFKDNFLSSYLGYFESPLACEKPKCCEALIKLQLGDRGAMEFLDKVWFRDAKFLNYYSKV